MKIVQVVNSITAGGAERLVSDLHREYCRLGHDSVVIAISGKEQLQGDSQDGFYCLGCSSLYSFKAYLKLLSFFKSSLFTDVDVVHVHLFPALFIVPLALKKIGWNGKLFASEHSTSNRRRDTIWGKISDKFTYLPYQKIVCVSGSVKDALDGWQPVLATKTVVIPNGARLELFEPPARDAFHKPVRIISVGRLTQAKNYFAALDAIALLSKSVKTEFEWLIAGDGKLRGELESYAKNLNIISNVEFLGTRNDVSLLLKKADVFFIPSLWEGFGIAAVEAMASGLPVVGSDVPGLREVIGTDAGVLVNPKSTQSMLDGLSYILNDQKRALKIGANGPQQASQFSLNLCVAAHIKLFS